MSDGLGELLRIQVYLLDNALLVVELIYCVLKLCVQNRAVGNDISQLSASNGDIYFGQDSTNNLFVGDCTTFVDLGVGNRILCGRRIDARRSGAA